MTREELPVDLLTVQGWYRGYVILPAGGRLLDYLNTKPAYIGLVSVQDPGGRHHRFIALNTDQVLAIRDRAEA
jgi:hypothetical protein